MDLADLVNMESRGAVGQSQCIPHDSKRAPGPVFRRQSGGLEYGLFVLIGGAPHVLIRVLLQEVTQNFIAVAHCGILKNRGSQSFPGSTDSTAEVLWISLGEPNWPKPY